MADDEAQTATIDSTAIDAPVEGGSSAEEKRFTQADIDRIVQERLARAERRGAPKEKSKAEPQQSSDDRLTLKQLHDSMQAMRIEKDFDRLALRGKLSETQAERLMPYYKAARVAAGDGFDGGAWLRDFQEAFGGGQPVKSNPARPAAAPGTQPVSDAGSPAPASAALDDGTPLWQMKPEDRQHFIKTKGLHAYAVRLRSELKGTRVSLKRP